MQGSPFKLLPAFLVCPLPDNRGPGSQLLETLILHHRQIDLPSGHVNNNLSVFE